MFTKYKPYETGIGMTSLWEMALDASGDSAVVANTKKDVFVCGDCGKALDHEDARCESCDENELLIGPI